MLAGYFMRKTKIMKYTGISLNMVIMLLFFFLGISVGNNEQIVQNFTTIGLEAFLLTAGGTIGSLLCIKLISKKLFKLK